jgi:hypothetical protein
MEPDVGAQLVNEARWQMKKSSEMGLGNKVEEDLRWIPQESQCLLVKRKRRISK